MTGTRKSEWVELLSPGPGTRQSIVRHRYGQPGARPKAYIQAAVHADEIPAIMAAHHLLDLLEEADRAGSIVGEIVLVPFANPIGLAGWLEERHIGRYELRGGGNFNRGWPNLLDPVAETIAGKLGDDAARNVALIRQALKDALAARPPRREIDSLKHALYGESLDADIVLDLHCDDQALLHLYAIPDHRAAAEELSADLDVAALLLDAGSVGGAFDETNAALWPALAARFPDRPIPPACFATTVELRGQADVEDALGRHDAAAMFRFLTRRGLIAGPVPDPRAFSGAARGLDCCQALRAPTGGILAYKVGLGERVKAGDTVADLIDPAAEPGAQRRALKAATSGFVFTLRAGRLVLADQVVAKILGDTPLPPEKAYVLAE